MPSVLFMCTGNIHRSPIAAASFKQKLASSKYGTAEFEISSAGTWTRDGMLIGRRTTAFAQRNQLDIRGHRSRTVTELIVGSADLVLVMEQGQLEAISFEFPQYKSHFRMLTAVDGQVGYDIHDPIRMGSEEHTQILNEIMEVVERKFDAICRLALELAST